MVIVVNSFRKWVRIGVIAGELEGSWRAGWQQEGLQYNGEVVWGKVIVIYCISAV